jgi:ribosomal protein L40E
MFYNLSCGNGPLTQAGCYSPRNAIIFLDRAGKFVAELEICFQCEGYELRPKEFHAGDMRRCKYDELRKLFARAGVHYGVDEQ